MKRLLFVTPELPWPAHSGGKIKSLRFLQSLAERYEVTLVCPLKLEDESYLSQFHAVSPCSEHLHDPVAVPRNLGSLITSYWQRLPLNVVRTESSSLRHEIARVADDYDIIVLDHYEVFSYLPASYEGLTIYHAHNAYYLMWERYALQPGNPLFRLAAWLESRRVKRYEHRVCLAADLVFASPNDIQLLLSSGADPGKFHTTYHLGDDTQLELPSLDFCSSDKRLMYVGLLGWEANVAGLLWFIEHVWPLLVIEHPDLRFDIVGKNPDARLVNVVSKTQGIELKGFVADLQTVYQKSRVSVAPLLFGSGMKVKVLDAMARGMPTVTTSVGAEGIDVSSGEHLLVADDARTMAKHVGSLLEDEVLWHRLERNSRDLIRSRYTWKSMFQTMHRAIDGALGIASERSGKRGIDVPHYAS